MVDVVLPEPRPDDNEDVVWALSTGAALGRGASAQIALCGYGAPPMRPALAGSSNAVWTSTSQRRQLSGCLASRRDQH